MGGELVGSGLVASLARPGGNVTGIQFMSPDLIGKRLEILKQVVPQLSRVGVLWESATTGGVGSIQTHYQRQTEEAARALDVKLNYVAIRGEDLDSAFRGMLTERNQAALVFSTPLLFANRRQLIAVAARHRLPVVYEFKDYVTSGGLVSYGVDIPGAWRQAARFVDRILKGANPADLPIEQPTTFELVINLATAKALGLTIPPSLLLRADQVIE
jgi:ABC-type uncharacterized transport system substrate-binding protein